MSTRTNTAIEQRARKQIETQITQRFENFFAPRRSNFPCHSLNSRITISDNHSPVEMKQTETSMAQSL
jgi:hypothetical protein